MEGILICERCETRLCMREGRNLYCPKCKTPPVKSGKPLWILSCNECEDEGHDKCKGNHPLVVTPGKGKNHRGSYCDCCEFAPSMQDTFFQFYCPECFLPLMKTQKAYRCKKCRRSYSN